MDNLFNPVTCRLHIAIFLAWFLLLPACTPSSTLKVSSPSTSDNKTTESTPASLPTSIFMPALPSTETTNWKVTTSFSGKNSEETSSFYPNSTRWRATWAFTSNVPQYATFNIFIYNASTGEIAGSRLCSACLQPSGQLIIEDYPNSYYLKIICANLSDWKIDIEQDSASVTTSPVQISLIHYLGTPTPLSCCNNIVTEKDEFVVIHNFGDEPQNLNGWQLKSLSRDYISFTFPQYFPCVPYSAEEDTALSAASVDYQLMTPAEAAALHQIHLPVVKTDWAQCVPLVPLDKTPMKPENGTTGQPLPCVIYPHRSLLIFTDAIHCKYGGLSYNYGPGDIWDNQKPDTAILYNEQGKEVSRRSYTVSPRL